jgi:hypothetical protein
MTSTRTLATLTLSAAVLGGLLIPAYAQENNAGPGTNSTNNTKSSPWTGKRRPDGQPDVQGFWLTAVYGMGCLSNPKTGPGCKPENMGNRGGGGRGGRAADNTPAASRIIDTPDGQVPYQPWAKAKQQYLIANYFEPTRTEFIDPQQLCLPLGAVRQMTWHDVHILQYDGYVIFNHEGGHIYQVIPLDGRPHISSNIKLWMGDPRGHWEGNTLVIDVTNNNAKGRLSRSGDFSSDNVHHTIRITFHDDHTARYEAVFDDPTVYTRPWTFGFDLKRAIFGESNPTGDDANYEQWEEACVEGMKNDIDRALRPGNPIQVTDSQP